METTAPLRVDCLADAKADGMVLNMVQLRLGRWNLGFSIASSLNFATVDLQHRRFGLL